MSSKNKSMKMKKKKNSKGQSVQASLAKSRVSAPVRRAMISQNVRQTRVAHREYVTDISVAAIGEDFQLLAYRINPANANLFPWLGYIARNYESYRIVRMSVDYVPACAATVGGTVVMGIDYDPLDASPQTKAEMCSWVGVRSGRPWQEFSIEFKAADAATMGNRKFTIPNDDYAENSVTYPTHGDPKTYDSGYLNIAVCGHAGEAAQNLGEIYVDYVVELYTPQINAYSPYDLDARVGSGGTVSKTNIIGDAATFLGKGIRDEGWRVVSNAVQLAIRSGAQYVLNSTISADGALAGFNPTLTVRERENDSVCGAVNVEQNQSSGNAATQIYTIRVNPDAKDAELRFDASGAVPQITGSVLRFAPYPYTWS